MNREECDMAEVVHNGGPIDWAYWGGLSNITPAQAARLVFHIDPFNKEPGEKWMERTVPDDLLEKIDRTEQLLRNCRAEWNLNDLVIFFGEPDVIAICGEVSLPYGMVQQKNKIQPQVVAEHERMREQWREEDLEDSIKRGRYTIELAALFISRNTRSKFEDMKNELKKSVENDELKFYDTDMDAHFKPRRVREFLGEVIWDELNEWLKNKYPRLGEPFPAPEPEASAKSERSATKKFEADPIFSQFDNLHARDVSLHIGKDCADAVIRGKPLKILPKNFGLKSGKQGWNLLEIAAMRGGNFEDALKSINKTSNRERERNKVTTAISRLREKLVNSMGLHDDPI